MGDGRLVIERCRRHAKEWDSFSRDPAVAMKARDPPQCDRFLCAKNSSDIGRELERCSVVPDLTTIQ